MKVVISKDDGTVLKTLVVNAERKRSVAPVPFYSEDEEQYAVSLIEEVLENNFAVDET